MHVEHLVVEQQRLLDQHAEGADDERLRLARGDRARASGACTPRAGQLEPELARGRGDRRRRELAAASLRAVGARDDELGRCGLSASRSSTAAAKSEVPR